MNSYTLGVSKIDILFVLEILRVISFPIPLCTDSHSICTNPEVSVRPMAKCGRFTAVRRGHKTQSLQLLDQFLSKSMDQSPTPAVFRATLGINIQSLQE